MEWQEFLRCDQAPAWSSLRAHYEQAGRDFDMRRAFAEDSERFAHFSQEAPHLFADLSKNRWDEKTEQLLLTLAEQCQLERQRDALLAGALVNTSEARAALHTVLRKPGPGMPQPPGVAAGQTPANETVATCHAQALAARSVMLGFATMVRENPRIQNIVNIGIGGSDLGVQMALSALAHEAARDKRFYCVANVDGHELAQALAQCQPDNTLFVVVSKTFSTSETLRNARSALVWLRAGGVYDISQHMVAVTAARGAARQLGIETCFPMWDWVGGRYSLWSSVGLSLAIALGESGFNALLAGAHAMDEHFANAPLAQNLPVRLGLLDLWYRNFHGFGSRCVAPYDAALRRLPAYWQQLEMESNGKGLDRWGQPLREASAPVLWGEPGTNAQHAYFQLLHQGTEVVPVEFIAVREPRHKLPGHHPSLLANALAQARALLLGQADGPVHARCPGNRPSSFFVLERLDPRALGALLALYEHRVFVCGALWGVNSFDQWGVELGKQIAHDMEQRLLSGDTQGLDSSSAGLLQRLATKRVGD